MSMPRTDAQQQAAGELRHCAEDGIVSADGGTVLVVLCFGVGHLVELRLK